MYQLSISPEQVKQTLAKTILADGFDFTYDIEKSKGVYLHDAISKKDFLDFFTCFASVPLGYNHPKMVEDENFKHHLLLAALANPSNSDVYTQQYATFVDTFTKVAMPKYMKHAFFISGGTLAIENALKVAMDWKVQLNFKKGYQQEKGHQVLHFQKAFHGRSGYTMSLTNTSPEKTKWYAKFDWPRISAPVVKYPINVAEIEQLEAQSIAAIKKAFADNKDDICAIIIEPIQCEGGDNHMRREFFEQLRQLADEHEAMLIYDEVQTGVGLTGKFWCHEHFGERARPDIIAFGKKMQVCGIMVSDKVDQLQQNTFNTPSRLNSTWGGNLADMVRSTQILNIIAEDNLVNHAQTAGTYLLNKLNKIAEKYPVTNVRGKGLLCSFDFATADLRNLFIKLGMQNQVLFLGCGERTIRFRPALIMDNDAIDQGMAVMDQIMAKLLG